MKSKTEMQNTELPEHLRDYTGQTGTEDIRSDDVATPRLQLLQALSPELEDDDSLKAGEFYHSGAELGLGNEITVIPLAINKSYTLWRPRPEGGILARSRDGVNWDRTGVWNDIKLKGKNAPVTWRIDHLNVAKSGLTEWGSSDPENRDSQPAATMAYNMAVLLPDNLELGPAVISMQRSQIRVAKKLLGRLKLQRVPLFGLMIPLCSVKEQGAEGPFFQVKFGKFDVVRDPNLFAQARQLFELFQHKGVTVEETDQSDHAPGIDDEIPF